VLQHALFVPKTAVELIEQQTTHGYSFTSTESITSTKTGNVSLISQLLESHTYGDTTQSRLHKTKPTIL